MSPVAVVGSFIPVKAIVTAPVLPLTLRTTSPNSVAPDTSSVSPVNLTSLLKVILPVNPMLPGTTDPNDTPTVAIPFASMATVIPEPGVTP